ncbi:hypothetical protein K501DRAFT_333348 [Backusella circina FSU 941]|nr:hypothetical protein K501DRAFT_333348 [Backusella circina FSU 941]
MPKSIPVRDAAESKRWLIIGAHQAGATEKHIARISGLSKTAVRNIILNYQRTGTPCIPKQIPKKVKQKLIVEYDENGKIIESDEEQEEEQETTQQQQKKPSPKINVTTKDLIDYTIEKLKHSGTSSTSSKEISSLPKPRLPPPSKFDQDIRGYELWTHDDDMILLNYVLHHLHGGGWNELELRFNGRHSARLCNDRWQHLKTLLLKGIVEKQE